MKPLKLFELVLLWLLVNALVIFNVNAQDRQERIIKGEFQISEFSEFEGERFDMSSSSGGICGPNVFTDNIEPVTLGFNNGASLKLTDRVGTVRISSWPRDETTIRIRAEKKVSISTCSPPEQSPDFFLSQLDVEVFGNANELTVNSIFPEYTPSGVSLSLNYDIKIPKEALLDVLNKVGSIVIQDIAGSMVLDLAVGKIDVFYPAFPQTGRYHRCKNQQDRIRHSRVTRSKQF